MKKIILQKLDDVLIENKDSHTDNDDFAKIEDAMKKFIDKKELVMSDFVKIKHDFPEFKDQVVIFRQRSLKHIGEETMNKYPKLLTKSQFRVLLHDHDTRFKKEKIAIIQKIRQEENKRGTIDGRSRSERRQQEMEKNVVRKGGGLKNLLDGYTINI